jgi:serine/threonine protein kinase/tetratricopeptide (TPR) repeat protein
MSEAKQNREQTLFEAASQKLDADERRAFLDRECHDDAALRARLELLLEGHFRSEGFLTQSPRREASLREFPPAEPPPPVIGRYKLLEKIGEGGFGEVWMAEQREPVKRRVAVKILKLGMDTKQVVGRFEAERQALALMDHPNIAHVLDAGATDTGRPYFVLDLVRGVRITDYCDQHNLSTNDRLELFISVCQAIQHAHHKGIIHRDIKPSNILVTLHDGVPVPKVIDFGIAKATQQELTDKTLFTQFQQFLGTPAYVSPEQAGMSGLDIDTRSDIYSLGVLLYELLVGRTPFETRELMQGGLDALRKMIREREPMRPSTKLNTLNAEEQTTTAQRRQTDAPKLVHLLRGDLDWIVMKCLEKDRTRRYDTANGLVMDLKRHLAHEPVEARPPGKLYRAEKFVRRHRVGVAMSVSVVTVLVAGLVLTLVSFAEARRERDAKETEAARAKAVSELLLSMLDSANPDAAKGVDYTVRELLDTFSANLGDQLKDQPEVAMSVHATIGKAYRRLRIAAEATLHLDAAVKLAKERYGPEDPRYADMLVERAHPDLASAEAHAREALAIYHKHPARPEDMIGALYALQLCLRNSNPAESEKVALEAVAYAARFPDREFAEIGSALHQLARLDSNPVQAEATARQAVDIHRRLHGPNHPETGWGLRTLGNILSARNKVVEAEVALREAYTIFGRNLGPNNPTVLQCLTDRIGVLQRQGKLQEAEPLLRENLAAQRNSLGIEHPDVAKAHQRLCQFLVYQGKFEEAESLLRESIAVLRTSKAGADAGTLFKTCLRLCQALYSQGNLAAAREELGEALKSFQKMESAQIDTTSVLECALLCLGVNDTNGHHLVSERVAAQLDRLLQQPTAQFMQWVCLAPDALTNYMPLIETVNRAIAAQKSYGGSLPDLNNRGVLLYRAGRHPEAREQLIQAYQFMQRNSINPGATSLVYDSYFLAMIHASLVQTNQSVGWFRRAFTLDPFAGNARSETVTSASGSGRLALDVVRREAETVLHDKLGTVPGHEVLVSFRDAWSSLYELLRKGRDACVQRRWADAAGAFDAALKDPCFEWRLAGQELSMTEEWIGLAFFPGWTSRPSLGLLPRFSKGGRHGRWDDRRAFEVHDVAGQSCSRTAGLCQQCDAGTRDRFRHAIRGGLFLLPPQPARIPFRPLPGGPELSPNGRRIPIPVNSRLPADHAEHGQLPARPDERSPRTLATGQSLDAAVGY